MRATLLYNRVSGKDREFRAREIRRVGDVLRASGYEAEAVATRSAGSAAEQVCEAVTRGCTHVFACGGDGTVHDVLQGVVECGDSADERVILGIIPMGSANALARHLGLSMVPVEAARQSMSFAPRTIPVGRVESGGRRRYFTVIAGAGPDGALVYKMLGQGKRRLGRIAYYARAAGLFATRKFDAFELEYVESSSGERHTMRAVSAMAVRVGDLGGIFSRLGCAGEVHRQQLQLVAVKPPGWIALPAWFVMGWMGVGRWNPLLRVVEVSGFHCTGASAGRTHVQADGEWIGELPMRVTLLQDAIRLLMPTAMHARQ